MSVEKSIKAALPEAPDGTRWTVAVEGDQVRLQLRKRAVRIGRGHRLFSWSTQHVGELHPDPVTGVVRAAEGIVEAFHGRAGATVA